MSVPFQVKALHEYKSDYEDDLQFSAGQVITVTEIEDEEWYSGTYGGKSGLFPKNFVETIVDSPAAKSAPPPPPPVAVPVPTPGYESVPVPKTEKIPQQKTPVADAEPVKVVKEAHVEIASKEKKIEPEVTQHDLEIDDLIRKNSTALPEPLDEAESVFEGNMKHVEESGSESSISEPKKEQETPSVPPIPVTPKTSAVPPTPKTPSTPSKSSGVPIPRVPMPGSLPSQRDDPYAIKKQFIGVGKSSYVPRVKPRDNSNVPHGFNDVSESHEVVRETDAVPQEESNEPKMSLKERIAMLQKRQQEEAEREAAALKKKEERKRKVEEEKKLKASQPVVASDPPNVAHAVEQEEPEISDLSPTIGASHSLPPQKSGTSSSLDPKSAPHHGTSGETAQILEDSSDSEVDEEEEKNHHEIVGDDAEEAEDGEAEEEEEEDDEDLRRKRLVERMAKISGGRNMFGMMGMPSPFGNTPAPAPTSKPKQQAREAAPVSAPEVPSNEPESLITPVEKASRVGIPIPGIVPQADHQKKDIQKDDHPQDTDDVSSATNSDDDEDEATEAVSKNDTGPKETVTKEKKENLTPENFVQIQDSVPPPPVRDPSHKNVESQPHSMNIVEENVREASFPGYEADADVSDRGALCGKNHGIVPVHPESPSAVKSSSIPVPPTPKVDPAAAALLDDQVDNIKSAPVVPDVSLNPPLPPAPPTVPAPPGKSAPPVPPTAPSPPGKAAPPAPPVPSAPPAPSAPPVPSAPPAPSPPTHSAPPAPPSRSLESDIHPPVPSEDAPLSPVFQSVTSERFPHQDPPPLPTGDVPSLDRVPSQKALEISEPQPEPYDVTDEHVPSSQKRAPPPIPSDPPLPPSSQFENINFVDDEESETSEDDIKVVDSQPNFQAQKSQTFSHPESSRSPEVSPNFPIRKSATGSFKRESTEFSRKSGELRRSGSFRDGRTGEQDQAAAYVNTIEVELADLAQTSGWWIKSEIPDSLGNKLGVDLEYEVDENKLKKRDGREMIYKDYYILFHDLSQIVFEIQYQSDDPRDTVNIGSFKIKGSPKIRKDILHGYSSSLGQVLAEFAGKSIGSKLGAGVVEEAFHQLKSNNADVLNPIGEKAFGVVVYKNFNHNITRIDEIRPGDILCIKSAKFHSHKGLAGLGSKSVSVGDGDELYTAVVLEYDPKKEKVKVAESGKGGVVKKESYKFGEMKSGKVRVYRAVPRESVGW